METTSNEISSYNGQIQNEYESQIYNAMIAVIETLINVIVPFKASNSI